MGTFGAAEENIEGEGTFCGDALEMGVKRLADGIGADAERRTGSLGTRS